MGTSLSYIVEFIPKLSVSVTSADQFLQVACADLSEAEKLESSLHRLGWVARIVEVATVRRLRQ